ncbi:hypothetical protein NQ318_022930 [Aromia moschata]|uniref:Aminotransferase class I/classII large domain-containing protein n=1 Tax=Aromia moschata TaxID=1265417 RepID=A0AAV8XB33_9CUCU|nr:hypothetical protein NQ318_022930 [Aromia moschata]
MANKFNLITRLQGAENNVWREYGQLAVKYKPVNLGLGFPDFHPPKFVLDALADVVASNDASLHQYARPNGHLRLVNVLAKLYSKLLGREINAETEILTTLGASEALFCAITGLVDVGDEVIIIEPYFDVYVPLIKIAGGVTKFIALKPKQSRINSSADFVLDQKELENLFTEKTKAIILNTPNNPLGKVFDISELNFIADLCKKWNVICISDEVYEWMVYKPKEHIRIASLPGMWERTVTIGSAGKTFCMTGWKVGWVYGNEKLLEPLQIVHHCSVFTGSTPEQEAVAVAFEKELSRLGQSDSYLVNLEKDLKLKRDYMVKILSEAHLKPVIPDGSFFLVADWSSLETSVDLAYETGQYKDFRFTKWMTKNVGLLGIPPTIFYTEKNKNLLEKYVRFCFIKKQENLEKAAEALNKLKN